jgi:hypothetical protein
MRTKEWFDQLLASNPGLTALMLFALIAVVVLLTIHGDSQLWEKLEWSRVVMQK